MLASSPRRHDFFLCLHILYAARFSDFPRVLIDGRGKGILSFLLLCSSFLFGHFLGMHHLHFLSILLVEVVQIKLLTWSMHVSSCQFFLLSGLFLLKLGLSFKFGHLRFLISIFELFLVSCTGEDRSLFLDHFHASLVDIRLERRLRSRRIYSIGPS